MVELFLRPRCFSFLLAVILSAGGPSAHAQSPGGTGAASAAAPSSWSAVAGSSNSSGTVRPFLRDQPIEPYPTNYYLAPFSRLGIGADVSPLGIGIKGAVDVNASLDARLMQNFFSYNSGRFELSNVNVDAKLRLRSTAVSLDWYPFHSIWRFSIGSLFFNGNQISASTRIASGTSVKINGQTFYSANPSLVAGATPLTGTGVISLHTHNPALTLSGGFGRFISHSDRHWSFPSDFGVVFMGAPTVNLNMAGWACLDQQQTQCSNVGAAGNPVAIQFNNAVQSRLTRFRQSVSGIQIYPMFSYSVVYSFKFR